MLKEPLRNLLLDWAEKRLEVQRAVGQMLRHLTDIEKRLEKIEKRLVEEDKKKRR